MKNPRLNAVLRACFLVATKSRFLVVKGVKKKLSVKKIPNFKKTPK